MQRFQERNAEDLRSPEPRDLPEECPSVPLLSGLQRAPATLLWSGSPDVKLPPENVKGQTAGGSTAAGAQTARESACDGAQRNACGRQKTVKAIRQKKSHVKPTSCAIRKGINDNLYDLLGPLWCDT